MIESELAEIPLWSWIHLSDVHFGHGDPAWRSDQRDVVSQMLADFTRLLDTGRPSPAAILLTGDIAFSGGLVQADEYADAELLIDKLRRAVGSDIPVFTVPGNHDVQRTPKAAGSAYRLLTAIRDGLIDADIDASLADEEDKKLLHARFANYTAFCERVGAPVAESDGHWVAVVPLTNGHEIRLIGWNSAMLANDDEDEGKLRIAKSSINAAMMSEQVDPLVFALTHHPVSWLAPEDAKYLSARLFRYVDVHFHGHVHDPDAVGSVRGSGQQTVTVTAGALHAERDRSGSQTRHAYNLGAVLASSNGTLRLRVWPRRWSMSQATWVADSDSLGENSTYLEYRLKAGQVVAASTPDASNVRRLAESLTARVGRRRTAYPTDMSIRELFEQDLVVPTMLQSTTSPDGTVVGLSDLVARDPAASVLVLGAPGSGKTVLTYELSRTLLASTTRCPLFVDLVAKPDRATLPAPISDGTGTQVGSELHRDNEAVVVVVDGVDEALAGGLAPSEIAARLSALAERYPLVVSCRAHDYEARLASYLPDGLFDHICTIRDWEVQQFADFVDRLVERGHLPDKSLTHRVSADVALAELIRRPLRARMLTFLADSGSLPSDVTALYTSYLNKLGSVTDVRIRALGCSDIPTAISLWRGVAWEVFSGGGRAESMPIEHLLSITETGGLTHDCAMRSLAGVIDIETNSGATFVHYSFFEFLVAQHLAELLSASLREAPERVTDALTRDLPLEIRRHLVRLLRRVAINVHDWPGYLASVYTDAGRLPTGARLNAQNIVAYLMCRLDVPADRQLLKLLDHEAEPFLRNSLLWSLARCNSMSALLIYLRELDSDRGFASLNRGYLLYYYGDLRDSLEPPHADDEPYREWLHTREILNAKYSDASYSAVAPARKAVDIFTFCDIAAVRGEVLSSEEHHRFTALLFELTQLIPAAAVDLLDAKLSQVAGP